MTNTDTHDHNTLEDLSVTEPGRDEVMAAAGKACRYIVMPWTPGRAAGEALQPELAHLEFAEAATILADIKAEHLTMPRGWYAQRIETGAITADDIAAALKESLSDRIEWLTVEDIQQHVRRPELPQPHLPTIAELASVPGLNDLAGFVSDSIAGWLVLQANRQQQQAYGDEHCTPCYAAWRQHACLDDTADKAGLCGVKAVVATLPTTVESLLATAVHQLRLPLPDLANWFSRQLSSLGTETTGAALLPRHGSAGSGNHAALLELLAIRVAWDLALLQALRVNSPIESVWTAARQSLPRQRLHQQMIAMDCVLQTAYEKSWQRSFIRQLQPNCPLSVQLPAAVQVVFGAAPANEACRRAVEKCSPMIETLGMAGLPQIAVPTGASAVTRPAMMTGKLLDSLPLRGQFARLVLPVGHTTDASTSALTRTGVWSVCGQTDTAADTRLAARILNDSTLADRSQAGLAAFIAAPRALPHAIKFEGRVCLHSYDWQHDPGYRVLEQIMTAPMLAASCLNLQAYGQLMNSSAAGDYRQSTRQPVRLSVLLAAPVPEIDHIIARHSKIRDLVNNGWIHMFAVSPCGQKFLRRFSLGGWTLVRSEATVTGA